MFQDLVAQIAQASQLRPCLQALLTGWRELPPTVRRRFRSPQDFAQARWADPLSRAFAWHRRTDVLGLLEHPFTAQVVYKSGGESCPLTWELVGLNPIVRRRLVTNLQTIEAMIPSERPSDLRVAHCEIITALRMEELALHRQAEHVREFLVRANCRVLAERGIDDADALARREPFAAYAIKDCRSRFRIIIEQFFAVMPKIMTYPTDDPVIALRVTGADQLITFDPERRPRFELEPVLKAECDLYLRVGALERDVTDLGLTIEAAMQVLEERFPEGTGLRRRESA